MQAPILGDAVDYDIGAVGKPGAILDDMVGRVVLDCGMEGPMDDPIAATDHEALAFLYCTEDLGEHRVALWPLPAVPRAPHDGPGLVEEGHQLIDVSCFCSFYIHHRIVYSILEEDCKS